MCKNVRCLEYIYLQGARKATYKKKLKKFCKNASCLEYIYLQGMKNDLQKSFVRIEKVLSIKYCN